jgi:hypothetical protein
MIKFLDSNRNLAHKLEYFVACLSYIFFIFVHLIKDLVGNGSPQGLYSSLDLMNYVIHNTSLLTNDF